MKKLTELLLVILLCGSLATPLSATTYYFAPSTVGGGTRADCSHALIWTDATNGMSAAATQATGGNGNVMHMCPGTYTCSSVGSSGVTFNADGSVSFPVTVQLDTTAGGVNIPCGYWGDDPFSSGAATFTCSGHTHILIDGGNKATSIILNTANGTNLMYQMGSSFIQLGNCTNVEVKSLTIQPAYVRSVGDVNSDGFNTSCIFADGASHIQLHDLIESNCYYGINLGFEPSGSTDFQVYNVNFNHNCHFMAIGDGSGGASLTSVSVHDNQAGPNQIDWQDTGTNVCHADGFGPVGPANSGSTASTFSFYNNQIISDACNVAGYNCTGQLFIGGVNGLNIFNNVLGYGVTGGSGEGIIRLTNGGGSTEQNVLIANNTFIGTVTGIKVDNSATITAENNVYNNGIGQLYWDNVGSLPSFSAFSVIDYNNSGTLGARYANGNHGDVYGTLAAFHSAFPSFETHSNNTNPNLSSTYAPLLGSGAINTGVNLTSLSITALNSDKNGNARPSMGAWTMGAFIFQATPPPFQGVTIQ